MALLGLHLVFMLLWRVHLWARLFPHEGTGFFANPLHAATILAAGAAAIAAGLLALFALVRRDERSLVLVAIVLYGLFVAAFALGEVLFPH